jgi:hypothetical protein
VTTRRARLFGALAAVGLVAVDSCGDDDDNDTNDTNDTNAGKATTTPRTEAVKSGTTASPGTSAAPAAR